jgi:nascent polypeptide-associated complex subunit alpha
MMPNMDPKTLKSLMAKMGIQSTEIPAQKVVIYGLDRDITIESPQITRIEMQGNVSFQIVGIVSENEKKLDIEISPEDIRMVMEKTGITDEAIVRKAIKDANGDIAAAIMDLTGGSA